jgi:hypothetical protein
MTNRRQTCIFCDRQAGSREHLWPAWIHRRLPKRESIRITFANRPIAISNNPEITVKTVCGACNGGWMSDLEERCIPVIGNLMQDISLPLDTSQQTLLATWTMKTAMVLDSTNTRDRSAFYAKSECENLRLSSTIPDGTKVWIGRSPFRGGLHAGGANVGIVIPDGTEIGNVNVATLIVGHLALQVRTVHALPAYKDSANKVAPKPGPWNDLLVQAWPANSLDVTWPPRFTFTDRGTSRHIGQLIFRWNKNVG